ncbi:MAG: hypothetical protein U9R08_03940 [Nanoarchaeota archaeon]|nr:hypothetical protein [Nanoarchaeota archaeon]
MSIYEKMPKTLEETRERLEHLLEIEKGYKIDSPGSLFREIELYKRIVEDYGVKEPPLDS